MAVTHMPGWFSWRAPTCAFAKLIRGTDELQPYLQKVQPDILSAIKASKEPTQKFTTTACMEACIWGTLEG